MEGAVRSGYLAAEAVTETFGSPPATFLQAERIELELALIRFQDFLAKPDRLRGHFHEARPP